MALYIPTDKLVPGDILRTGLKNQFSYEVIEDLGDRLKVRQVTKKPTNETSLMNKGVFIGAEVEKFNPYI